MTTFLLNNEKRGLQAPINAALAVCDEMVARELGRIDTKPRQRRATRVRATPDSPKLRALKAYRKVHPGCSLRQAAGNVIETHEHAGDFKEP